MEDSHGEKDPEKWMEMFSEFAPRTAMAHLDIRPTFLDDQTFIIESTIGDAHRQPLGLLHGGVNMLFAETVASFHAAWLCDLKLAAPVGVDINGTHLSSAKEGELRITAKVLRRARAFVFHEVEIYHLDTDRILCSARVTNYLKPI